MEFTQFLSTCYVQSLKSPCLLSFQRHFPRTTFPRLWSPLHKVRRIFTEKNTFSSTDIKTRAAAAFSWSQNRWGWHFTEGDGWWLFKKMEMFSLSGKSPDAASPWLVRWLHARKSSGTHVFTRLLPLGCSPSPHGPRCQLELHPSQLCPSSRKEERTKGRGEGSSSVRNVAGRRSTKLPFSS